MNSWVSRTQNVHTTGIKWYFALSLQIVRFNIRSEKKRIQYSFQAKLGVEAHTNDPGTLGSSLGMTLNCRLA